MISVERYPSADLILHHIQVRDVIHGYIDTFFNFRSIHYSDNDVDTTIEWSVVVEGKATNYTSCQKNVRKLFHGRNLTVPIRPVSIGTLQEIFLQWYQIGIESV